jgi:hypothetical protein
MAFKRSSVRFRLAPPKLRRAISEPDRVKIGRTNAPKLLRLPH